MQRRWNYTKIEGHYSVTEIVLKPKLTLPFGQTEAKAIRVLEMSEKACAISNSIKTSIHLVPDILIVDDSKPQPSI